MCSHIFIPMSMYGFRCKSMTPVIAIGKPYQLERFWDHSPFRFSENSEDCTVVIASLSRFLSDIFPRGLGEAVVFFHKAEKRLLKVV